MKNDLISKLIEWRQYLHAHPELSGHESETAAFVAQRLTELRIPFEANVGSHGIVATLKRGSSIASVGLRGDMDALQIAEENELPYVSQVPGVMHACGHDGHTVALLGAVATLAEDTSWEGTINFIFQPAEETGTGAEAMIADGLFERFPMDRVFAFHNWPGLEAGMVGVHHGPVMAASTRWEMTLKGLAGHGARPHTARDPIVAAGHLIVALQSIVARNVDPADSVVLSIGSIHGGAVSNQIPASVSLLGTLRTYEPEVRSMVVQRMETIGFGIAASYGMQIDMEFLSTGYAIVNSPGESALAVEAARQAGLPFREDLPASGAGDDFSSLIKDRPGAYIWIGNGLTDEEGELHNSRYDFNDNILPVAVDWLTSVAKLSLSKPDL